MAATFDNLLYSSMHCRTRHTYTMSYCFKNERNGVEPLLPFQTRRLNSINVM